MVTCPNCKLKKVKVVHMNFASLKPEGQPAKKQEYDTYSFFCFDCEHQWESDPQVQKDYLEYLWLRDRTSMIARDMNSDRSYGPAPFIDSSELTRRNELAKKIVNSYKHALDISPSEWYKIEQDSR
ncbi:MAG: hypothetical protein UR77_C0003G0019 [Candidatus Nomurabacteria bacterium GW2011_GWC2_35_35]|nr:MAG: hypothetical protein UR77_C0003G0019 [Candidatus Nomurabacteria bacterium GW2011_GWC2_35_35]KKP85406.1 MAG: hypothetical protein UR86_C0004G0008 [Parcubacteria group bacterium GW2011_GWD2_35_7]